jgi:hypothetical protein
MAKTPSRTIAIFLGGSAVTLIAVLLLIVLKPDTFHGTGDSKLEPDSDVQTRTFTPPPPILSEPGRHADASPVSDPDPIENPETTDDDCRSNCVKEYPDSFQEWHRRKCFRGCYCKDTSLRETDFLDCMRWCDRCFPHMPELQQRHGCYRECSKKFDNTDVNAIARDSRLPKPQPATEPDQCILRCMRYQGADSTTRRLFLDCCQECERTVSR